MPTDSENVNIVPRPAEIRPDEESNLEQISLAETSLEGRYREQIIENLISDRILRENYSKKLFQFLVGWSLAVLFLLVCQGAGSVGNWFHFSDQVLSILVGSTTASIIGLIAVIVKYLFRGPDPPPPTK